jgi:hypothetical protein
VKNGSPGCSCCWRTSTSISRCARHCRGFRGNSWPIWSGRRELRWTS